MDRLENSAGRVVPQARIAAVGWLLTLGALGLFGMIADSVDGECALTHFDSQLVTTLHEHAQASPTVVAVLRMVTALGSASALTTIAIAIAAALVWRGHHTLARVWGLVFAGCLLHDVLKHLFQRPRPHFQNPFVLEAGWSFPSGHAMGSLIGYGLLAYLLWLILPHRKHRTAAVIASVLLVLVIGFSRLYLGAHYFSDVIAGYAAGAVWLCGSISGIEFLQRSGRLQFFSHASRPTTPQPQSAVESA